MHRGPFSYYQPRSGFWWNGIESGPAFSDPDPAITHARAQTGGDRPAWVVQVAIPPFGPSGQVDIIEQVVWRCSSEGVEKDAAQIEQARLESEALEARLWAIFAQELPEDDPEA